MGYKAKIAKTVLSEWGETLGTKLFGKNIPTNVKPILGVGANSMSKIDAMSFSKAIDLDGEVQQPLGQLLKSAGDGNDDAFGLLANAARDFQVEDQGYRVLDRARKNISGPRRKGTLSEKTGRAIIAQGQTTPPSPKRAKSIPPNLPQEEIDSYVEAAEAALLSGKKNRVDVPYLTDKDGRTFRLDNKGGKKYGLQDQELKNARNAKLQEVRTKKGNLTTRPGVDQREFYADPDYAARHKKNKEEPHHRAPLHPSSKLKEGLTVKERKQVDSILDSVGIVLGNDRFNRDNLPKAVHKKLHSWLKKNKLLLGDVDMSTLSMRERMKYLRQFIMEMQKSDQKTYKLMQAFMRLNRMKGK
tara:strand:+ start:5 stop:1075 length:1071 start_codon:yes stop_codon:yes gene_type:complete